jgi:uncharacterized membrane-anchored protein
MTYTRRRFAGLGPAVFALASLPAVGAALAQAPPVTEWEKKQVAGIEWQNGPTTGDLAGVARITVPASFKFTGARGAAVWQEANLNPSSTDDKGVLCPADQGWFILFQYRADGYVKDDDRDRLDATAMLETLQRGSREANQKRRDRGWGELNIVGWELEPAYDAQAHSLTWAFRLQEGKNPPVVNFHSVYLGRHGFLRANLVADARQHEAALPAARRLLSGFSFRDSERYTDQQPEDKVAEFGLAAVVTGVREAPGGTGLPWGLIRLAVVVVVVVGGAVVGLFKKLFGHRQPARDVRELPDAVPPGEGV